MRRRTNAEELECSVQFEQQDRQRVNLDRREVDNSGSCSEGRRVEREKSSLVKKFKTNTSKMSEKSQRLQQQQKWLRTSHS